MMENPMLQGIVRISGGTGFVVTADGLIATCAHVIKDLQDGDEAQVIFHVNGEVLNARVEVLRETEDVAILRIDTPLPEGIKPLPLGSLKNTKDRLDTFGFPEAKPIEGMAGKCEIIGETTERGFPVLQLRASEITAGFSGAPVYDLVTHCVIGMVAAIVVPDEYGRLSETAFIIPSETLREVYPALPFTLRELLHEVNVSRLFVLDRSAWASLWRWLHAAFSLRPVWSALSILTTVGIVVSALFSIQAYKDRGWRAISGGYVFLGQPDNPCPYPVEPFEIQITEVRNADYLKCVEAEVCDPPVNLWQSGTEGWIYPTGRAQHPVWSLSWNDADTYCQFIDARLPTEAEWVFAARGSSTDDYPWLGTFDIALVNVYESDIGDTIAVTTYPKGRSETGLYHLIGNIREWVVILPAEPCDTNPEELGAMAKGGSFMDSYENTPLWYRARGDNLPLVGVRCARD